MLLPYVVYVLTCVLVAQGNQDFSTNSNGVDSCSRHCEDLTNRLEKLEAQAATQADIIRRMEKEISEQKRQNSNLHKRIVLGTEDNVAFTAYLGHNMYNIQDKQKLVFENVITNEGGFYNNTTGIFTAPENGLYQFIFAIDVFGAYQASVRLVVGGINMMGVIAEGRSTNHNDQGCNAMNVHLSRGENVWLEHHGTNGICSG